MVDRTGVGSVSVCMATYNGATYIGDQLLSIICQLQDCDEVIVVDDCSTDATLEVVGNVADTRIKIHRNRVNLGHVKTFERAIGLASNEFVLLSDQDDIWLPGRRDFMVEALAGSSSGVIATAFVLFEGDQLTDSPQIRGTVLPRKAGRVADLFLLAAGRQPYFGCAMGFRTSLTDILLPFPKKTDAHDHWLAIVGVLEGGVLQLQKPSLVRRIHGSNLTTRTRRPLVKRLATRMIQIRLVLVAAARVSRSH